MNNEQDEINTIDVKNYSWLELTDYCVDIYKKMKEDEYIPEVIISISRGGFFTGLILAHLFKIQELYSIKASTNINDDIRSLRQHPQIESLFTKNNIHSLNKKKILIVDDVFNTGYTLKTVYDYMKDLNTNLNIRTACMIYDTFLDTTLPVADFIVDYYSDKRCAWAVFPWETIDIN